LYKYPYKNLTAYYQTNLIYAQNFTSMKFLKNVFVIFIISFSSAYSQKIGVGLGGIYNFRTKSIGYDIRLHWQVTSRLAIVPQYNRFPAFNKIFEQYYGLDIDYTILPGNPRLYVLGGIEKNYWFNYYEFDNEYSQPEAFTAEVGLGLRFSKKCVRPYVELRYNTFWQEINARAGIIFFFGGCDSGHGRARRRGGGKNG
jgi:hypothetical protein